MEQIFPSQHVLSIYYHYYTLSDGCLEYISVKAIICAAERSENLNKNNLAGVKVIHKIEVHIDPIP